MWLRYTLRWFKWKLCFETQMCRVIEKGGLAYYMFWGYNQLNRLITIHRGHFLNQNDRQHNQTSSNLLLHTGLTGRQFHWISTKMLEAYTILTVNLYFSTIHEAILMSHHNTSTQFSSLTQCSSLQILSIMCIELNHERDIWINHRFSVKGRFRDVEAR